MAAELALVLAFIIAGGFFAAAEMALVSLRPGQVARIAEEGRRGKTLERLLAQPNRFLSAVQIGVTLAGFLSSAVGAVTLAEPLGRTFLRLGVPPGLSDTLALLVVTAVVAYLSLVLGELAPKRLALQRAEGISLFSAPALDALATAARPVIWLLGRSTNLVVRLIGGDPHADRETVTEEELRDIVASNDELTNDERRLINEVLDAGDRPLREIMVPRLDVNALSARLTLAEATRAVGGLPHSRYPVVDGGLDDVLGFVHLRDLLTPPCAIPPDTPLASLARPIMRLPDSRRALPALAEMRNAGAHLAVVVDEYGGGAGIVTLEDLIEELIGDITDEFDPGTGTPEGARPDGLARPLPEHPVDAQLRLEEFEEATGVALPEGPYDTAAGWLLYKLGRIPEVGDTAVFGDVRLTVAQMRSRRVERVTLARFVSPNRPVDQPPASTPPGVSPQPPASTPPGVSPGPPVSPGPESDGPSLRSAHPQ